MTTSPFQLRPYHETEIEELRLLERAAHRRYLSLDGYEKFASAPAINPERFRTGTTMVAEWGERRVGYVIVQPLDGMLYIASLMVADGMSGHGIGKLLVQWAEDRASETGVSGTCLATFRVPRWNAPWYRKLGYSEIPQEKIGEGLQAILNRHSSFLDMSTRVTMWKPR